MKTVLAELEKLDVGTRSFTDMLTKPHGAVVEHADQKEKQEFIKLEQELGNDALQHLGRAAKLAEVIAPTRPHAGVESQVVLFAGPFHGDDGPGTRHHHRQGLT
jgi:hypothetical protein